MKRINFEIKINPIGDTPKSPLGDLGVKKLEMKTK